MDESVFPPHKGALYLTHNQYKSNNESVEFYAARALDEDEWVSAEERERALATGELWELQWYPDTPNGFYKLAASSLPVLLEAARKATD